MEGSVYVLMLDEADELIMGLSTNIEIDNIEGGLLAEYLLRKPELSHD